MRAALTWTLEDQLLSKAFDLALELGNLVYVLLIVLVLVRGSAGSCITRCALVTLAIVRSGLVSRITCLFCGFWLFDFREAIAEADIVVATTSDLERLCSFKCSEHAWLW